MAIITDITSNSSIKIYEDKAEELEELKLLERVAIVFKISKEKIARIAPEKLREKCFKKMIRACDNEDWEKLNAICDVVREVRDAKGRTLFDILNNSSENIPNFHKDSPENIIFQGGGPKGIAYIGVILVLLKLGKLSKVKRFAGTSAGAITAGLLAVGHTAERTLKIMTEKSLLSLLDFSLSKGGLCKGEEFIL